jgi:hypothetical protein
MLAGHIYNAEVSVPVRATLDVPEVASEVFTLTKAQIETRLGGTLPPLTPEGMPINSNMRLTLNGVLFPEADEELYEILVNGMSEDGGPIFRGTDLPADFP